MTDEEPIVAISADQSHRPLRSAATRLSDWIFGTGEPDTAGYYVSGVSWPAGARESDLPISKLYEVLNDSFDNYFDSAVASLAKVQPPSEEQTKSTETRAERSPE